MGAAQIARCTSAGPSSSCTKIQSAKLDGSALCCKDDLVALSPCAADARSCAFILCPRCCSGSGRARSRGDARQFLRHHRQQSARRCCPCRFKLRLRQLRYHRAREHFHHRGRARLSGISGVDIEPWRLGLRPTHPEGEPQTIRFRLSGPAKLSISRPGDFLNQARMLFLFAGSPPPPPPTGPNVTIVPAGIHRESLNPKSGDTIYLEPGAYVFGSLNLWQVDERQSAGPRNDRVRRPPGPERRRRLDAEARLALHRRLPGAQRRDRRPHLHRSLAYLVDPDEGFHGIQLTTTCA